MSAWERFWCRHDWSHPRGTADRQGWEIACLRQCGAVRRVDLDVKADWLPEIQPLKAQPVRRPAKVRLLKARVR